MAGQCIFSVKMWGQFDLWSKAIAALFEPFQSSRRGLALITRVRIQLAVASRKLVVNVIFFSFFPRPVVCRVVGVGWHELRNQREENRWAMTDGRFSCVRGLQCGAVPVTAAAAAAAAATLWVSSLLTFY